jgi:hypothetical protein
MLLIAHDLPNDILDFREICAANGKEAGCCLLPVVRKILFYTGRRCLLNMMPHE